MDKIKILIYTMIVFIFLGCGPSMNNLNLENITKNNNYPILIHLSNNSIQTKFSKVVEFDKKRIKDSDGELFIINNGVHELKVKWTEIINDKNVFLFYNNIGTIVDYGDFLKPKKEYLIKENFEAGYTYMIDSGDRYRTNKVHIPKKLCLLRRKSLKNELKAYRDGTIFNNMNIVSCFEYNGDLERESIIANWPW